MADEIEAMTVDPSIFLAEAMNVIDSEVCRVLFVVNDADELLGTVSDGDIRRGILDGMSLSEPVSNVMNKDPVTVRADWSDVEVRNNAPHEEIEAKIGAYETLPVPEIDDEGRVVGLRYISPGGDVTRRATAETNNVNTVLIIGGAGYIGSVMSRKLLHQGYSVRVLDNLMYGDHGIGDLRERDEFTLIEGDMRSIGTVVDATRGTDAVVHLGALVGDPASAIDSQKTLEINYHAVKMAAEICRYHQINRFVFASTCSVYGQSVAEETLLTEDSVLNPVSLYAQTKIESEKALLDMDDGNFSPTVLRMATVYGLSPRMRFDLVVNILTAKAWSEGTVPIFGGDQYRPNVHVADAAQGFIDTIEAPIQDVAGEVFNVGSNEQNYQIREVGELVSECFPQADIHVQREQEDERSYQVDFSKAEETLGYEAEHTITDGVEEIREALESGRIADWQHDKYSNYRTLEDVMPV